MMARAHKLSGTFVSSPVVYIEVLPLWVRLATIPIATYAALVPDWDHHSSTITKATFIRKKQIRMLPKRWSKVGKSAGLLEWLFDKIFVRFPFWFVGWNLRVLSRMAQAMTYAEGDRRGKNAHRMLTHTGLGCIGFGLIAWGLTRLIPGPIGEWSLWWGVSVFLGCFAHVLGDMLTPGGCPLWWPRKIGGKRWHMVSAKLFKTDSMIEKLIVVPVLYFLIGAVAFFGALIFYDIPPLEAMVRALLPG